MGGTKLYRRGLRLAPVSEPPRAGRPTRLVQKPAGQAHSVDHRRILRDVIRTRATQRHLTLFVGSLGLQLGLHTLSLRQRTICAVRT